MTVDTARASTPAAPLASVAGRALLVLVLLLGFYVLALGVVAGLALLTFEAGTHSLGPIAGKLGLITAGVALALGRAVFRVERSSRQEPPGLPVTRGQEPALWAVVDQVARATGAAPPDELRLTDDVNAYVVQRSRLLGLVGGRRTMGIGLALLHALTVEELRGVLAHEYGHYAGGDTRLGPLSYRASSTVGRSVAHLGPRTLVGRLFTAYARLVFRTSLAVRRRQELSADVAAARLVGADVHEAALRAVHAGDAAYSFFLGSYVDPLVSQGVVPDDLYGGFRALLADPVRQAELEAVRGDVDGAPADPYDSHPSLGERLALISGLAPAAPGARDDDRATRLLADPAAAGRAVTAHLVRGAGSLAVLRDGFAGAGPVYALPLEQGGGRVLETVATVDGGPRPADLARALDLLEQGRGQELVVAVTRDRRQAEDVARDVADTLAAPLAAVAGAQLVEREGASWQVSWGGPVRLLDADGDVLGLQDDLHAALLEPARLPALRARWTRLGVDLHSGTGGAVAEDRDRLVMVLPDARPKGEKGGRVDLLLTYELLVVVPFARGGGVVRGVRRAIDENDRKVAKARAARLETYVDRSPAQLAAQPGAVVHRWDELERVGLGGQSDDTYGLSIQHRDRSATWACVDSPVPTGAVVQLLARLVGDRLRVSD